MGRSEAVGGKGHDRNTWCQGGQRDFRRIRIFNMDFKQLTASLCRRILPETTPCLRSTLEKSDHEWFV